MKIFFTKIFVVFLMLGMFACQNSGGAAADKPAKSLLGPQAFQQKIEELPNEVLIDLRTHGELHKIGPIKGSKNADFNGGVLARVMPSLDKELPIMVYCASGGRSADATKQLKEAGFKEVYDLEGGIEAWKAAGLPIQKHSH